MVQPRQEEQDDDRAAHGAHAPELGVDHAQQHGHDDQDAGDGHAQDALQVALDEQRDGAQHRCACQHPREFVGGGAQHRVERREVPDRSDVRRRLQRVSRDEVV
ncbi:hypothetical protein G6F50_018120 [Rhizopus delemar]|uniref:Uncharacterized protein n=1 Tax=Rhizopus delemar TaxID=936053 RepID=A0A9P7BZ90_9FUNG|nr:hypothetical protein G6F50_018120 [Rhizopus delemar]